MGSVLCKMVPVLQGTNIMVSVGTITVIALDRYFTIVRRSSQDAGSDRRRVVLSIALVWLFSLLATLPIFFFQVVESFTFQRVVIYETCIERWPTRAAQLSYTVCVLLLQSVIPALVVSVVHARIASYLHAHAKTQKDSRRARKELERNRKTTLLLTGIAVMFAGSWLPLSLYSLLVDGQFLTASTDDLYVALAVCHLVAMSSAVSNPIVYGWLNSNIRHEFLQLLPARCAASLQRQHSGRRPHRHSRRRDHGTGGCDDQDTPEHVASDASSAAQRQEQHRRVELPREHDPAAGAGQQWRQQDALRGQRALGSVRGLARGRRHALVLRAAPGHSSPGGVSTHETGLVGSRRLPCLRACATDTNWCAARSLDSQR